MRLSLRAQTVEELTTATRLTLVSCVIDIALNLVAAILVSRIWVAQRTQRENPAEFAPAPGFADFRAT